MVEEEKCGKMKHWGEGSVRVRVTYIPFQSKVTMVNLYLIQGELCSHQVMRLVIHLIVPACHCQPLNLFSTLLFLLLTEVIMVSNNKLNLLSFLLFLFVHPLLLLLFALK